MTERPVILSFDEAQRRIGVTATPRPLPRSAAGRVRLFGHWHRLLLRVRIGRWLDRHAPCWLGFHEWRKPINGVAYCEKCARLHPAQFAKLMGRAK